MTDEPFHEPYVLYKLAMLEGDIYSWCNSVRDTSNYPYEP